MIDLTELITAGIGLIAAVITGFVIPYIRKRTGAAERENLRQWALIAVRAAEQLYGSGMGKEKKRYVTGYLASRGYTVDDTMIESAVGELFSHITEEG